MGRNVVFQPLLKMPIIGGTSAFRLIRGFVIAKTHLFTFGDAIVKYHVVAICKVVIYNYVFCWLYFVPNLIVISFNLLYPVFIVGFNCKGCVIEKECVKTQAIEDKMIFMGSSRLSIPRNDACALHMTGMRRVRIDGDSCVSRVFRR